jgi:tRNA(Ile)-lysidine synthase
VRLTGCFDRRLEPDAARPVAAAVSGGADSLFALIETAAWAKTHGRTVLALSVDHGLQAESGQWTAQARTQADRLGCDFKALRWDGVKPDHGVSAKARLARHRLLADAARAAGARVIVTGHTGDDALENAAMGLGPLYEWSPSPVWPQGRGVGLLRPLLGHRRQMIRDTLQTSGWTWVDDPANANLAHPRIRARRAITPDHTAPSAPNLASAAALARTAQVSGEAIRLSRDALRSADLAACRWVVGAATLSLGGGETPPRKERLDRLIARLAGDEVFVASLAGARITADPQAVRFTRNAGEAARGGLSAVALPAVWDGRYDITGQGEVGPLRGHSRRLPPDQRRALANFSAEVRPGLPVVTWDGAMTCPVLANDPDRGCEPLVPGRFLTRCGVNAHESELE